MLTVGKLYNLNISEQTHEGFWLRSSTDNKVLMPTEYAPKGLRIGDYIKVFLYYNKNGQLTASADIPKAVVGDFATLKVLEMNVTGAFLDWGLPVHLFLPRSFHEADLAVGDYCLVKVFLDKHTGKILAKERLEDEISNEVLTVKEKEVVQCIVYKNTGLGYQIIVNEKHLGLLYYTEVFKDLYVGDRFTGFIKNIKEDNKLDVMIGKPGHTRVEVEADTVLELLKNSKGFLPYHDKSPAEEIYKVFGMSKKTFKMTIGNLYRRKQITVEDNGRRLVKGNKNSLRS